ncbi:hypothetical protein AORI_2241 [Amycolatopsis keratiniphila]|uniref:Uncharacterized protein n=1 Tax=Amycolatopsis keratiniphila TaxID=129921 RepID=R4SMP7_9PSEU|nr:hypothetical protein AORI_2241 [Amycolatopsis keratiniphila]
MSAVVGASSGSDPSAVATSLTGARPATQKPTVNSPSVARKTRVPGYSIVSVQVFSSSSMSSPATAASPSSSV